MLHGLGLNKCFSTWEHWLTIGWVIFDKKLLKKIPFTPLNLLTFYEVINFLWNSISGEHIQYLPSGAMGIFLGGGCPTRTTSCFHLHHFLYLGRVRWSKYMRDKYNFQTQACQGSILYFYWKYSTLQLIDAIVWPLVKTWVTTFLAIS
jgi:hypothetical protein